MKGLLARGATRRMLMLTASVLLSCGRSSFWQTQGTLEPVADAGYNQDAGVDGGANEDAGPNQDGGPTTDGGCVLVDCQDGGYTCCPGFDHCVDPGTDSANCGSCGTLCTIGQACVDGGCAPAPCTNGQLCGAAGGCCLGLCCYPGQICCRIWPITSVCHDAADGCPLPCRQCP
jgi:hypothetical protein